MADAKFLRQGLDKADNIHFNLDGFEMKKFQDFLKKPEFRYDDITNWELHEVLTNPSLLKKTKFYGEGGKLVSPPSL